MEFRWTQESRTPAAPTSNPVLSCIVKRLIRKTNETIETTHGKVFSLKHSFVMSIAFKQYYTEHGDSYAMTVVILKDFYPHQKSICKQEYLGE